MPRPDATHAPEPARRPGAPARASGVGTPRPKPPLGRRVGRGVLLTLGLLTAAIVVITQSGLLVLLVKPTLRDWLGVNVQASRNHFNPFTGVLTIDNLALDATDPDQPATAARIVSAHSLQIQLSRLALIRGRLEVAGVKLDSPVIRVSMREDIALNIDGLVKQLQSKLSSGPAGTQGGGSAGQGGIAGGISPDAELKVTGALVELGEHTTGPGATYTALTSIRLSGAIKPQRGKPGSFRVEFAEEKGDSAHATYDGRIPSLASGSASPPMRVTGGIDLRPLEAHLTLTNVDLGDLGRRRAPQWMAEAWEKLGLAGSVREVSFSFEPKAGPLLSFAVEKVDMDVPIPTDPDLDAEGNPVPGAEPRTQYLAMRGVTGTISLDSKGFRARLDGMVEDLPAKVDLRSSGGDRWLSGFSCVLESSGFAISERPRLLPFAPPAVRLLFERFGGPTARADARIQLSRAPAGADGKPNRIKASGTITFRDGRATHELFRYPVSQLSGKVEFGDDALQLLNIKGVHPNGARLWATGRASPLDDTAQADIQVTVTDIPLDQLFLEALPENRRVVFEALFDRPAFDAFCAEKLLQSREDKAARSKALADIRAELAAGDSLGGGERRMARLEAEAKALEADEHIPEFELGGRAVMEVAITRALGAEAETKVDVRLTAEKAGLMLKAFPLPVYAHDVDLMLGGSETTMKPMKLSAVGGGTGTLSGRVDYAQPGTFNPDLKITATGVRLDERFIRALPGATACDTDPDRLTARKLVDGLHLAGAIDLSAVILPDPFDPESASFRVDIAAERLSASPGNGTLKIDALTGGVSVFDGAVEVPWLGGQIGGTPIEFDARAWYGSDSALTLSGTVRSPALDLKTTLEDLLALGAPRAAEAVADLRRTYLPEGCAAGEIAFIDGPDRRGASMRIESLTEGEFSAPGGRCVLSSASGRLEVTEEAAGFVGVRLGAPGGSEAELDGSLALDNRTQTELNLRARGARFEDPLVRSLASMSGEEVAGFVRDTQPRGEFAAHVVHRRNTPTPGARGSSGWLEPRSLELTRRGARVELTEISGRLSFSPEGGRMEALSGKAPSWSVALDGTYTLPPRASLDMTISLEGEAIGRDLRAALPEPVADALEAVEMGEEGRFQLSRGRVRLSPGGPARFDGAVMLEGVTLRPVVPITQAAGEVRVSTPESGPGGSVASAPIEMDIRAESFRLAGVRMSDGRARLRVDAGTGTVNVSSFEAMAHGGRLSARGRVDAAPTTTGVTGRAFEFEADLSNIRFGDILADLYPRTILDESAPGKPAVDRGRLDGSFSIAGRLGDTNSRRGRGLIRVQDGEVLDMPAIVPILRLSNLQPPVNQRVGFGYADFYIQGEKLRFDEFTLQSRSLAIDGRGSITWPGLNVDMKFVTRSLDRIPLLTDVIEGVRDELVTTSASGTLYDPQLKYEQLTATRQMFEGMFGKRRREDLPAPSSDQPARTPE